MKQLAKAGLMACTILSLTSPVIAEDHNNHAPSGHTAHRHNASSAPQSVMGDHMHGKGDWMLSYRYMHMDMGGNRDGTNSISPEEIVTSVTNPHAPPPTLRVVPTDMTMDMHMLGVMYGLSDTVTLMLMGNYIKKEMDHITFAGMAGTTRLGTFATRSSGWGDTTFTALIRLYEDGRHHLHLNAGLSAPTGSIKKKDDVLTPMGTTPTLRLPYAMQLGSGTWDALPGITYTGNEGDWFWGAQFRNVIRLESENDQGYRLGNRHALTSWVGYRFCDWMSASFRIKGEKTGKIKGEDAAITAPVQTADPDNYGGKLIETGIGFEFRPPVPELEGLSFGAEVTVPVYQNLNGPQMERDWNLNIGLTYRF
ncbi:MAG: transporter [Alphaproteobacteria bacterium]|nr:transporter [Alphaproteobacteria bacterium]